MCPFVIYFEGGIGRDINKVDTKSFNIPYETRG